MSILKDSIRKSAHKRIDELMQEKWILRGNQKSIFDVYKSTRAYILRNRLHKDYIDGVNFLERVDCFLAGFGNPEYKVTKLDKPKIIEIKGDFGTRKVEIHQHIEEIPNTRGKFPKQLEL
jgi:hypothetical protein